MSQLLCLSIGYTILGNRQEMFQTMAIADEDSLAICWGHKQAIYCHQLLGQWPLVCQIHALRHACTRGVCLSDHFSDVCCTPSSWCWACLCIRLCTYVRMYVRSTSCSHTSHPLGCFFHLACINNYISTCYKFGSVI